MAVAAQTLSRGIDRIFAYTRDFVMRQIDEHAFNHSPATAIFLGKLLLKMAGPQQMNATAKDTQTGGNTVLGRANLGIHQGAKRMNGPWDTHNVAPDDNVRFSELPWRHYSGNLTISLTDRLVNAGSSRISSIVEHQTQQAMLSVVDLVGTDFYALSTAVSPNAIQSIDQIASAGDAVQVLNGSTYTNWNARGISNRGTAPGSISFAGGSFALTGIQNWRRSYNNATEGAIRPNVILTAWEVFEYYEGVLQPQERFTQTRIADAGFETLAFKGRPVFADDKCPTGYTYFVNTDLVRFKVLAGADFMAEPFKPASNQEASVSEIVLKGNLMVHNRKLGSNKITGQTA